MARKKLDRVQMQARVSRGTKARLHQLAASLGYVYNAGGSIGAMLDAIATGELALIPQSAWKKISEKFPKSD